MTNLDGRANEFFVTAEEDGARLDKLLCSRFEQVGRKLAGALCENGQVRVAGKRARKSRIVREGEHIRVVLGGAGEAEIAHDVPLTILLELPEFVIVDKPAGVPSAALPGKEQGTLAGALLAKYPEMSGVGYGPREPGLIHRLDTYTSGVLIAARTAGAFVQLKEALSAGQIEKHYLALVEANVLPAAGVINAPLTHDRSSGDKVRAASDSEGHACETHFQIVERGSPFDLVELRVHAAFRHQIRAHLAHLGAPLVGDTIYGSSFNDYAPRHSLHASLIKASLPNLPAFRVESPLPADLAERRARS